MSCKTLDYSGPSLETVRHEASTMLPDGLEILGESVVSDGREARIRHKAETVEAAFDAARSEVPPDAKVLAERVLTSPGVSTHDIPAPAPDDLSFYEQLLHRESGLSIPGSSIRIESVTLKQPGRRGFLGIGARLPLWTARVWHPAAVEVVFQQDAHIRVEVGRLPDTGGCQTCGKPDSPWHTGGGATINCFCSAACGKAYMTVKLATILAPSTYQEATARCWSCGSEVPMTSETCPNCGRRQEFKAPAKTETGTRCAAPFEGDTGVS